MKLIPHIQSLEKNLSSKILYNEDLSKLSWFNLGGKAQVLFRPQNLKELSFFLKEIKGFKNITVLGAGSNTLIRDGGYNGVVIKFGKSFSHLSLFDSSTIIAGASVLDKKVASFAEEKSIGGFEFLSCIPGTIGGAIRMNSGCYGEDISGILVSIQAMNFNGDLRIINASDINFNYRGSNLEKNLIFISATLKGKKDREINIKAKTSKFIKQKENTQPSKIKTCGSTFKNPENKKAWSLIRESGCAGMREGGAQISEKHCNFFINKGNANSNDLEKLIIKVQKEVFKKTKINLELEIKIIGEKNE